MAAHAMCHTRLPMAIYLVTPLAHNADKVKQAVTSNLEAADYLELQARAGWLVKYAGTSVELSRVLGVTPKVISGPTEIGSVLITSVGSYYGRGPTPMWEWLKTRIESGS